MCLLVIAWQAHPRYRLIVAANRDEFHDRPAAPMARWPSSHGIVAGNDLRAGGTWLGIDAGGRFGIITNFRDLQPPLPGAPSRGSLIPGYLGQDRGPAEFLTELASEAPRFSGFNLLLSDRDTLCYASNRADRFLKTLAPGVYGLSNHLLDTPWPKLVRVRERFHQLLKASASLEKDLFAMLTDRTQSPRDPNAPPGRLPPELEKALSAPFVLHPSYGTRCSTVVLQEESGAMRIVERSFEAGGAASNEAAFDLPAGEVRSGR